jgi:DNA-binding response OmpR family regulator
LLKRVRQTINIDKELQVKKIMVVDESSLFRDFLQAKLSEFGFEVIAAVNGLDGSAKLRRETPDLVIMDYYLSRMSAIELLTKKTEDPNTAGIPVIMATGKIDREQLVHAAKLGVKKVFTKPIRIDALVKTISELLGVTLNIDSTPCIIEAHFNDQILFVEVAQGLNREKIELLKYKIVELMELYEAKNPKVLIIMSSIEVDAEDSIKLGSLFSTVLEHTGARPRQVKVLTNSDYVKQFIAERPDYEGIEVSESLESAMDGLLGKKADAFRDKESNTVDGDFLQKSAPRKEGEETIDIKFQGDRSAEFDLNTIAKAITVAIVDDDFVIRELVKAVLTDTNFEIKEYENGKQFVEDPDAESVDLVFLDLMMPEMDGFQVMAEMKRRESKVPIIVLSALSQRETVVKALQNGVNSYIIKPLDPGSVLNKAKEILKASF